LVLACVGLFLAAPIMALAALGIRMSSPGPVFYRARLLGRHGRPFTMFKLRTMHIAQGANPSLITAERDPRVFPFGAWLRRSKLDELPQLVNVLLGDMSIVGPRPEHAAIVRDHYSRADLETLAVRPGLTSPGTLFDYTHGEALIGSEDSDVNYVRRLLPMKLALDRVYVRDAGWWYDARLILRTAWIIAATLLGRREFDVPREYAAAIALLENSSTHSSTMASPIVVGA
jgi:lipopolysaccharide/colanic/teichoic acid biosynthesis glycosyltransferase